MHVERNMGFESLYAVHVRSHLNWNLEYEVDQTNYTMDGLGLDRGRDCLFHRMSPF